MSLYGRLTAQESPISVHAFGAALRLWSAGSITRQNVVDAFSLGAEEQTELEAIQATYTALPTNNINNALAKQAFRDRMEDVFILSAAGLLTEAQAKNLLGF